MSTAPNRIQEDQHILELLEQGFTYDHAKTTVLSKAANDAQHKIDLTDLNHLRSGHEIGRTARADIDKKKSYYGSTSKSSMGAYAQAAIFQPINLDSLLGQAGSIFNSLSADDVVSHGKIEASATQLAENQSIRKDLAKELVADQIQDIPQAEQAALIGHVEQQLKTAVQIELLASNPADHNDAVDSCTKEQALDIIAGNAQQGGTCNVDVQTQTEYLYQEGIGVQTDNNGNTLVVLTKSFSMSVTPTQTQELAQTNPVAPASDAPLNDHFAHGLSCTVPADIPTTSTPDNAPQFSPVEAQPMSIDALLNQQNKNPQFSPTFG